MLLQTNCLIVCKFCRLHSESIKTKISVCVYRFPSTFRYLNRRYFEVILGPKQFSCTTADETMWDYVYVSPKWNEFVDRLRRKLPVEFHRRRQNGVQQQYNEFRENVFYEQFRQHALLLRQSNKASKRKRKSKSGNTTFDKRNQLVIKRQKNKLDNNTVDNERRNQNHAERMYRFKDDEPLPAKISNTTSTTTVDGISSGASVSIDHHINNVEKTHQGQKISTNVDVNQIVKSPVDSEIDNKTNVEYKQKPNEHSKNQSRHNAINNKNNTDIAPELADIFKSIENEQGIPKEVVNELNRFEEIYSSIKDSVTESVLNSAKSSDCMFASNIYVDHSPGPELVRTPSFRGVSSHSMRLSLSEGGLAAETLKRMAAQHQLEHDQIGVKSAVDRFSDLSETGSYGQRNGFSPEYSSSIPRPASTGLYPGQQQNTSYQSKQQSMPVYNQTTSKLLVPYAHNVTPAPYDNGSSSLQQLRNRGTHFNPNPQMEITQTQHMQVSDGSNQMQQSQTQHAQLRQPLRSISLTQQQGFETNSAMGPHSTQSQNCMGSNEMTFQWQQMLPAKMLSDPLQQAHLQQQYTGKRPLEYKMQHSNDISGGNSLNGMGPSPLQTIQNMVNRINTHHNQVNVYSSVKNGSNDRRNGKRKAQMSAMLQRQQMNISMCQCPYGYSIQPMQRQASYPGSLSHQMPSGMQAQRLCPSTCNSKVVRSQRPPNVNYIDPDGLKIYHSCMPQDCSCGVNPMTGHRSVSPTSTSMMDYSVYSSEGLSSNAVQMQMQRQQQPPRNMHILAMESQKAAMMRNNAHAQQMLLQQQTMQMAQQQMVHVSNTSVNTPYGITSQQGNTPYISQTNITQDILNVLDTTPNQTTEFLDVRTCGF